MADMTYICDCLVCKHHWVSRAGFGTPDQCPKCRGNRISIKPAR